MHHRLLLKHSKITCLWHVHPPHHWFFIGSFCLLIRSLRSWFLLKIELSSQPLHWLPELMVEVPTSPSVDNILPQSTSKSFCCLVRSLLACRTGIIIVRSCFSGEQKEELSDGLETNATGEGPSLASCLPFVNKYRKLPLINPGLTQVREGFWVGL